MKAPTPRADCTSWYRQPEPRPIARCSISLARPKPFSRKLGRVGEISLAEARARCRDDRAKAARGEDPRSANPALLGQLQGMHRVDIADEQIGKENVTALEVQRLMLNACEVLAHSDPSPPSGLMEIHRPVGETSGTAIPTTTSGRSPISPTRLYGHMKTFFAWCAKPNIGLSGKPLR